jgi:hypothetical protein
MLLTHTSDDKKRPDDIIPGALDSADGLVAEDPTVKEQL